VNRSAPALPTTSTDGETVTTLPLVAPDTWQDQAACGDADADLFFSLDEDDQREALAYCDACPVRSACLEQAVRNREQYGIWGGMREQDRRRLTRERRQAA
jgi:WhiB family transcriptional regulator, redox-sensing transcriptional regulator